jgi:endonuclease/exonuclease/phosphatase family metal-dependent hydrolase
MLTGSRPHASAWWQRGLAGLVLVLGIAACLVIVPSPASAHTSAPGRPTGLRVVKISSSSLTVTAAGKARHFRLFVAHRPRLLATKRISRARKSRLRRRPQLTLRHLHFTTRPFYYRVEARNGRKHRRYSSIEGTVSLQPATPTGLTAVTSEAGTYLSWHSQPATGFLITQATDPSMTQNVTTYTTANRDHVFTPHNLEEGTTYYFDVEALNGDAQSAPTSTVMAMTQSEQQPVRVMTYNIRKETLDGIRENGNVVAPWSQRRVAVAALINNAAPDAVAIQEGAALVAPDERQVDDLVQALGGTYSLAETEIPPGEPGHTGRTGTYILYRNGVVSPVDQPGHWDIGDDRTAAYQVLQYNSSGAQFLFVAPHLQVNGQPGGTDQGRENEDKSVVSQANAYAAWLGGLPIVYGGDFNSDPSHAHAFNGPSDYNLSVGIDDSFDVAQSRHNAQYNSANGYMSKPPTYGLRLDYLFVTPGTAVTSWQMLLNLSHGRYAGVIPSDHNPVVADLLIPYQAVS